MKKTKKLREKISSKAKKCRNKQLNSKPVKSTSK
tara:strand:- start:1086 stop:1187 length:102 start_codon:yes stop_codon:yes gene_type:complete